MWKSGKEPVIKRVTCYGNVSFLLLCDRYDSGGKKPPTHTMYSMSFKDVGQLWARRKKNKSGRVEKEAKSRRQTEATIVHARSRGLACSETLPNLMTPLWHQTSHLGCRDCSHIQMTWLFMPKPLTQLFIPVLWCFQLRYFTYRMQRLQIAASSTYLMLNLFSSSLIQNQEGISDRWNLTFIWTHSSVARVGAQSKNRPKTNRTEPNPAKIKHALRFTAAAPHPSLSFHFSPPFVPLLCIFFQSCHSPLLVSEALFEQNRKETET